MCPPKPNLKKNEQRNTLTFYFFLSVLQGGSLWKPLLLENGFSLKRDLGKSLGIDLGVVLAAGIFLIPVVILRL